MIKTNILSLLICVALSFSEKNSLLAYIPAHIDSTPTQYGTPFNNVPDRRDVIIYQVNMRAFSKEGNFAGVTARLDSIKALGANVIYLMPIYPVGIYKSVNSPYCIRDYKGINAEFGTLDDLRKLIDGAHSRNMSVILDWVGNHTAWDHPWVRAHRDWYKQDIAGQILTPGYGWTDVAQLDFTNMDMRQAMIADMKYWVYAANIDGFRCDYADGPPDDFWKHAIDTLKNIKTHKFLFLAEGTRSENFAAGFDYNFGFKFFENFKAIYDSDRSVHSIDSLNASDYVSTENGQQIVRYTTNHDVNGSDGTPLALFRGNNGSMAAFVVAACMKSVPMVYNGQEVGMEKNIPFPFTSVKIKWDINYDVTAEYKNILAARNNSIAIRRGELTSYSDNDVCAFTKTAGAETIFIVSNLRNKEITYMLPQSTMNKNWTDLMTGKVIKTKSNVILKPYSYMILKKK